MICEAELGCDFGDGEGGGGEQDAGAVDAALKHVTVGADTKCGAEDLSETIGSETHELAEALKVEIAGEIGLDVVAHQPERKFEGVRLRWRDGDSPRLLHFEEHGDDGGGDGFGVEAAVDALVLDLCHE